MSATDDEALREIIWSRTDLQMSSVWCLPQGPRSIVGRSIAANTKLMGMEASPEQAWTMEVKSSEEITRIGISREPRTAIPPSIKQTNRNLLSCQQILSL